MVALEIVEVDPAETLRARGDGDDPSAILGDHLVEQQASEQEWREMVEREGQLEPVLGDVAVPPVAAHIVDEHVQSRIVLLQFGGEAAHLRLRREVGLEHVDLVVARPAAEVLRGGHRS